MHGEGPGGPGGPGGPFADRIELMGFEGLHGNKVVKGAPFSATAATETSQVLQDGTAIHRTATSTLYRDSQGRSRHEVTLSGFGPLQAAGKTHTVITIGDPVAGSHYMLDPDRKIAHLRIFEDDGDKMNLSVLDKSGEVMVVSQFTLYGDVRRGRRPSFDAAARPEEARRLYEYFVEKVRTAGLRCATGEFQAMMQVELVNDGPVTIILDSEKAF